MPEGTCSIEGCERSAEKRGWCGTHYQRWRRTGSTDLRLVNGGLCSIDGCDLPASTRGWCRRHYDHWKRHGDPSVFVHRFHFGALCAVDGCGNRAKTRGWCGKHYIRWSKTGDPLTTLRVPKAHLRTEKRCPKCKVVKPLSDYWKNAGSPDGHQYLCKPCLSVRNVAAILRRKKRRFLAFCEAQGWRCGICGADIQRTLPARHPMSASTDHIVPVALGGTDDPENLQLAHLVCNMRKGARV